MIQQGLKFCIQTLKHCWETENQGENQELIITELAEKPQIGGLTSANTLKHWDDRRFNSPTQGFPPWMVQLAVRWAAIADHCPLYLYLSSSFFTLLVCLSCSRHHLSAVCPFPDHQLLTTTGSKLLRKKIVKKIKQNEATFLADTSIGSFLKWTEDLIQTTGNFRNTNEVPLNEILFHVVMLIISCYGGKKAYNYITKVLHNLVY